MFKSVLSGVFLLMFYSAFSQDNSNYSKNHVYNQGFLEDDSTRRKFFFDNMERIYYIGYEIFKLPFDACHHQTIQAEVYIDAIGMIREVNLISGAGFYSVNTQIRNTILNYAGNWEPALKDGLIAPIHTFLTFQPISPYILQLMFEKFNRNIDKQTYDFYYPLNGCEDSEFYYNKAIAAFREKNYTLAAKFFKKSLEYNKYDANARYNLGIAYVNLSKLSEACECFKLADEFGEVDAAAKLKKYCEGEIKATE